MREQLSNNRMQLAKGNISLVKELQERDNKIHELSVAYQQLQVKNIGFKKHVILILFVLS